MQGDGERDKGVWVYAVRYGDGSCHVGTTRGSLARRVAQHNEGKVDGVAGPLPATLVYWHHIRTPADAVAAARYLQRLDRPRQA